MNSLNMVSGDKILGFSVQVSGVSAAAGLKSGQSNLKRNFVLG
jgi:hypothetical protein